MMMQRAVKYFRSVFSGCPIHTDTCTNTLPRILLFKPRDHGPGRENGKSRGESQQAEEQGEGEEKGGRTGRRQDPGAGGL